MVIAAIGASIIGEWVEASAVVFLFGVAEWLEGRSVEAARRLDVKAVCAELEVPVEKLGKLLRIEDAVAACWRAAA